MRDARTALIAGDSRLPYLPYWLAIATMTLVAWSLLQPNAVDGTFPSAANLVTAVTSALCLFMIRMNDDDQGFMRIGFHAGVITFFLLMPLLFPDQIAAKISSETRDQIDLILLLSVIGFEAGYWFTY